MENSAISWTTHTFNPWRGCTKVSAGCANCYAETMSHRNPGTLGVWGPSGTRVVAAEAAWREPVKWNKVAALAEQLAAEAVRNPPTSYTVLPYQRPRVFCASLADVFEDWQGAMVDAKGERFCVYKPNRGLLTTAPYAEEPHANCRWLTMQDVRRRLFALIDATPNLDWLLVTKRPENVARMMPSAPCPDGLAGCEVLHVRRNVWLGTSAENQAAAAARHPHLMGAPAAVHFWSAEPLLGPINALPLWEKYGKPGWVIVGGESGPGARPMQVEWARDLVRQCQSAGVKVFVKQLGSNPEGDTFPENDIDPATGNRILHLRQVLTIRDKKGGDPEEWPEDIRVREFPTSTH